MYSRSLLVNISTLSTGFSAVNSRHILGGTGARCQCSFTLDSRLICHRRSLGAELVCGRRRPLHGQPLPISFGVLALGLTGVAKGRQHVPHRPVALLPHGAVHHVDEAGDGQLARGRAVYNLGLNRWLLPNRHDSRGPPLTATRGAGLKRVVAFASLTPARRHEFPGSATDRAEGGLVLEAQGLAASWRRRGVDRLRSRSAHLFGRH